jgi:hypothetical protein
VDESVVVQSELISQPADLRIGANEDEQGARFQCPAPPGLVVLDDDPAEFRVGDELANLGAVQDLHARVPLELVSQVGT